MSTVPTPETNPVDRAEAALREIGVIHRDQAEPLLDSWSHVRELTAEQRVEVLNRFYGTRCGQCHGLIEHVPVPPNAGPAWGPAYWRHLGGHSGSHAARPEVTP
jgi:hypothetical protein